MQRMLFTYVVPQQVSYFTKYLKDGNPLSTFEPFEFQQELQHMLKAKSDHIATGNSFQNKLIDFLE